MNRIFKTLTASAAMLCLLPLTATADGSKDPDAQFYPYVMAACTNPATIDGVKSTLEKNLKSSFEKMKKRGISASFSISAPGGLPGDVPSCSANGELRLQKGKSFGTLPFVIGYTIDYSKVDSNRWSLFVNVVYPTSGDDLLKDINRTVHPDSDQ